MSMHGARRHGAGHTKETGMFDRTEERGAAGPHTAAPDAAPLDVVLVSNGVQGLDGMFPDGPRARYRTVPTSPGFDPDFSGADVVIVPNGSDHVAMQRAAGAVRRHLDGGGALCCFDGWFTPWVPGNRWVMDNSRATRDVRYRVRDDRRGLTAGVPLDHLNFSHGMSGWWACGYIEPAPGADVVLEDTWGRPIMVLDEATTAGAMLLTASGPLAGAGWGDEHAGLLTLYHNLLDYAAGRGAAR
jgi:hypothetical protein